MKKRKIILLGVMIVSVSAFSYIKYYSMNINDLGLSLLGWVKKIKGNAVDLDKIDTKNTLVMNHNEWNKLLQAHVTDGGLVNYKGFIKDKAIFDKYLTDLSNHPPGNNWSENEKMAYWINTYNAFTVKLIIDHYPLKSIKDVTEGSSITNSPWDIKFFKIGGIDFDLGTIEHEILRKQFNEPRIHFAINCASYSCPKLKNEAYEADKLEAQLEEQASAFINNPDKNIISESETKLSKIFDWFKSDFIKNSDQLDYIKKYNKTLNKSNKVEYLDYIWTLNE